MVLVLDAVQDPGNVGTMLRTALALGAAGVVALKGTADLTNPKVLRGSMGAAFRLPAVAADVDVFLAWAGATGVELGWPPPTASRSAGRRRRRPGPVALVVGERGRGRGHRDGRGGEPAGRHPARPRRRVTQRGGRRRHSPVRGHA